MFRSMSANSTRQCRRMADDRSKLSVLEKYMNSRADRLTLSRTPLTPLPRELPRSCLAGSENTINEAKTTSAVPKALFIPDSAQ